MKRVAGRVALALFMVIHSGVGEFQKTMDGATWQLVMKLSQNQFCYGSSRWTDGNAWCTIITRLASRIIFTPNTRRPTNP